MFFSQFGDFILILVRAKLELGDFLLSPDATGKPAVGSMGLVVEGDLFAMQDLSAQTEFQGDLGALALEHTRQGKGTVDRNGGAGIGFRNVFADLFNAEE